jgi:arabinofuranosyltransferase
MSQPTPEPPAAGPPDRLFRARAAYLLWLGVMMVSLLLGAILIMNSSTVAADGRRTFALFDDAMISMRYADNLVQGRGLVWNPGERVEGFSSPLWVFVLAGFRICFGRIHAIAAVQFFGLALALSDLVLVTLITRRLLEGRAGRDLGMLAAVLMTITFYPLLYWSIMGMETGLLTPLLLLVIHRSLAGGRGQRAHRIDAILLSLACLTRPEAVLFVAVFVGCDMARRRRRREIQALGLVVEAALFALPLLAYQITRRLYFGRWYANSYLLKLRGLTWAERLQFGWNFSQPFLMWAGWLALGVALLQVWRLRHQDAHALPGWRPTEFLVLFVAFAAYQLAVGGDAWPLYIRIAAPVTPLLLVAFVVAVIEALDRVTQGTRIAATTLAMTFVLIARWMVALHHVDALSLTPIYSDEAAHNINAAIAVRKLTRADATIAAFAAGVLPYYAERRAIDILGRMDPVIASLPVQRGVPWNRRGSMPGHNKYDLEISLRQKRPTVIQWNGSVPCAWGTQDLSGWCREHYAAVNVPGDTLLFDMQSPAVRWDLIRHPGSGPD